jgi:hypothetical protein
MHSKSTEGVIKHIKILSRNASRYCKKNGGSHQESIKMLVFKGEGGRYLYDCAVVGSPPGIDLFLLREAACFT